MKKTIQLLVSCIISLLLSTVAFANETVKIVPNRYIIKFKNDVSIKTLHGHKIVVKTLQEQLDRNLKKTDKILSGKKIEKLWICNSIATTLSPEEVKKIESASNVEQVLQVTYRRWIEKDIDKKPVKWDVSKLQWSIKLIRAHEVWQKYNIDGSGIIVGHLDTGVAASHPLLKGKVIAFKDFCPNPQVAPYDDQGHGTHTAGSIVGDSGVGVAPGAKLIVAKVFDKYGSGDEEAILKAMQWVMDPDGNPETIDGPNLVSNSWGDNNSNSTTMWDAVAAWVAAGIVPVFAAGNSGPYGKVGSPASYPHAWAVAATTNKDSLAYFSSIGPVTWNGQPLIKPDIAAPGQGVISCSINGGLVSNSGTSMACPHVAGLVALMLQANPQLTIDQVRKIAEETAIDLGTPGKDNKFGSGRIDALTCIEKVLSTTQPLALLQYYENLLASEKALIGIQPITPLSTPLANSIIRRIVQLDEGQFKSLSEEVESYCGLTAKALLKQANSLRKAENLNK